jgi:hypothetical protein
MVSYSYFIFQLLQTVANGFNLLQSMDSATPASPPVANCFKLLQIRTRVTCHPPQPMRSIVLPSRGRSRESDEAHERHLSLGRLAATSKRFERGERCRAHMPI